MNFPPMVVAEMPFPCTTCGHRDVHGQRGCLFPKCGCEYAKIVSDAELAATRAELREETAHVLPEGHYLTDLQAGVIEDMLAGYSVNEIAEARGKHRNFLDTIVRKARKQFGARSNVHLVVVLERLGYIGETYNVKERV